MKRAMLMSAALLALAGCAHEDTPEVAAIRQACLDGNLTACQWIDIRDREVRAQRAAALESFGDSMQQVGNNMQQSYSPVRTTCYGNRYSTNCTSY